MATIKDVARRANVSLGTVSNVLNGKTQNEELIRRVEAAIQDLGYYPDATARSLKNTKTNVIGLILPQVSQQQYAAFLQEMESTLQSMGYGLMVKFSKGNRLLERKAVEAFLEQRVDGIVLFSTFPQKTSQRWENMKTPVVLLSKYDMPEFPGDNIVIECAGAFRKMIQEISRNKCRKVGLVAEQDLLRGGGLEEIYREYYPDSELVRIVDGTRERGFESVFELTAAGQKLDAIIVGNFETGRGVYKALHMLQQEECQIYAIKESNWIDDVDAYAGVISVPVPRLVNETVRQLMEAIHSPQYHENMTYYIPAEYEKLPVAQEKIIQAPKELHFAMYDCSSARSLELLSQIYEKKSGIKIYFDRYPYQELEKLLYQKGEIKDSYYDGFMIDVTWFDGLVESGCVKNLDHILNHKKNYMRGFVENAVSDYSMYIESLYSIPFMSGAQLLFYQKDLFEDRALQIKCQRLYNEKLEPPKTWKQFNVMAEFFTQRFHRDSPVKYGVSMSCEENIYMTIDFLDRLWSYGGRIFDELQHVSICSSNTLNALNNLQQSYQYTSGKPLSSWDECADEFSQGDSAMVVLYNSDVGNINNFTKSKVAGNIGCSLVPGGVFVMGGWSLGLNRYGKNQEEAENFLLWACSSQNSISIPILGGSTLRKNYYERSDLDTLEPWKNLILKSSKKSVKRVLPEILDESRFKNQVYTSIIPHEIKRMVNKEISAREAMENMQAGIERLVSHQI